MSGKRALSFCSILLKSCLHEVPFHLKNALEGPRYALNLTNNLSRQLQLSALRDCQVSDESISESVNPFSLVQREVDAVSNRLRHSVSTNIPQLKTAAEYFLHSGMLGKRIRPSIVLLMASATSSEPPDEKDYEVDLSEPSVYTSVLRRRQQRIAEISELIHVASLLHDDVIDNANTRRGVMSLNSNMGNKVAILAGDFLLARTSVILASLKNTDVVELMAQVLENLVSGEIMQMSTSGEELLDIEHYMRKTYCKTAALMANSSRSVAVLGGHSKEVCDLAWEYGRHLGIAFQVVDDILDLTASSSALGKPTLNDLKSGIATAPVLFAAKKEPELVPMILRRFKNTGDASRAMELVESGGGLAAARQLAAHHAELAIAAVNALPRVDSPYALHCREALITLTDLVLNRKK